jgi:uroporphyrinogen-III decarboxylase
MKRKAEELYKEREKRILAAINLEVADRVPVACAAGEFAWAHAGISMKDYMTDNEKMMAALETFHRDFQPDMEYLPPALQHPMTLVVAEPCLIKVPGEDIPADSVFQLVETEIMKEEDYEYAIENGYLQLLLKLLPKLRPGVPDVQDQFLAKTAAAPELLRSNAERLKQRGIPCLSGGGMESPFSVLTMLRSYEQFCLDLHRLPDRVALAVDRFTEEIAQLVIAACNEITGIPRAFIGFHRESSSFFSPGQFEQFALPQILKLVNKLDSEGIRTVMHCDGDWTPNLPYLRELPKGKCVLDLDASTDIFKAKELLGDRMCICGNLMEVPFSFSTPAEIEEHCKRLIDTVGRNGGFILNGEPSKEGSPENIRAMIHTARTYGTYIS